MQFQIYFFFNLCIIMNRLFIFANAKAMTGENVRQVLEGEFKYVVAIGKISSSNSQAFIQFCTGSLVSNRDVLLTEHCVENKSRRWIRIKVGSRNLTQCVMYRPLFWLSYEQWARHRRIRPQFYINDIAIIRLSTNVSNEIQPGSLAYIRNADMVGFRVHLAGWGKKENGQKPIIMETVEVIIMSLRQCTNRVNALIERPIQFEDTVICTSSEPVSLILSGDSGGPVVYMDRIVGISKGTCPFPDLSIHPEKVNVHFGLYLYREFIEDFINNISNIP